MNIDTTKQSNKKALFILFLVVLGALLFRVPGAFTYPQLFAEDGTIYLSQYEQYGVRSFIMSYGGYLHFVPRLISIFWGLLHVNLLYIPACYSLTEFFFTLFIAFYIWKSSEWLNIKNRVLYATCFLLLPIGSDIFMNLTNINWIGSLYLINFLFIRPTDYTPRYYYSTLILLFLISFSGPFSTLISPLIVAAIIKERKTLTLKKIAPMGIILAGGFIQFMYIVFIEGNMDRKMNMAGEQYHVLKIITNNTGKLLFFEHIDWPSPTIKMIISFIVFLALAVFFIIAYQKIANRRKHILLFYGMIVFASFVKAYWPNESRVVLGNPRYYFLPFICIAWLLILSYDKQIKWPFIAAYLAFLALHNSFVIMRLPNKEWKKQVIEYYRGETDTININPEGWKVGLPPLK
jgi:hypothetical protein